MTAMSRLISHQGSRIKSGKFGYSDSHFGKEDSHARLPKQRLRGKSLSQTRKGLDLDPAIERIQKTKKEQKIKLSPGGLRQFTLSPVRDDDRTQELGLTLLGRVPMPASYPHLALA